MKEIVFVAYLSNYGGIESLIIRMTRWLNEKGHIVSVLCDRDRAVNKKLEDELNQAGAEIRFVSFRKRAENIAELRETYKKKNIVCITFSYPGLIVADSIFNGNDNADVIFYDPHQFGLMMDYWTSKKALKPMLHLASKVICRRLYRNHQIIFMDHLCKNRTLMDFHLVDKYDDDVLLLPMEIKKINLDQVREKANNKPFNILTVCRMEFPFKGYVFGLIDLFSDLVREGLDVSLTIIGSGSNDDKLVEKIESVDKKVSERLNRLAEVPYSQLAGFFEAAALYIGMGTTVADAVNHGVAALPIGSYTYECKGYDFFFKDPENLGGLYGDRDIGDLVREIYSMNSDRYVEHCQRDYEELKKMYDIEIIGESFMSFKNTKHVLFNPFERKIISFAKRLIS